MFIQNTSIFLIQKNIYFRGITINYFNIQNYNNACALKYILKIILRIIH